MVVKTKTKDTKLVTKTIDKTIDKVIKLPDRPIPQITIKSKPYKALLLYILDVIKLNPDHHDQQHWRCDTSFCFAGFTDLITAVYFKQDIKLQGAEFDINNDDCLTNKQELLKKIYQKEAKEWWTGNISNVQKVEYIAKHVLGLSNDQCDALFRESYTLNLIENTIKGILNEEIV